MKRLLFAAAIAALLSSCDRTPAAPAVEITDLTCRPTPNGMDMTACFATFTSTTDDRLVAISSPNADSVTMHAVRTDNGMMVMREMEGGLVLPAGEAIQLRSAGDHIMVEGVHAPLAEGDLLSLAFTFEHEPAMGMRARIGQPALEGGGHH